MDISQFMAAMNSVDPGTLVEVAKEVTTKLDLGMIDGIITVSSFWYCYPA